METPAPSEPNQALLFLLVLVLFPLVGGTLFFLIGNLLAWASGWKKLAAAYPASEEPPGEKFYWSSAMFGLVGYNNCLNLIAGRFGLHLSMFLLLRSGHRPFYLPWSELTITRHRGFLLEYLDFSARKAPDVRLRIQRKRAEEVLRAAGQPLPE